MNRIIIAGLTALAFALGIGAATARADAQGGGGGMDTGGGDAYSQEFVRTGWSILRRLVLDYPSDAPKIDLMHLQRTLETVLVESTEEPLSLQGADKDALNYPGEYRIRFNRKRWRTFTRDQKRELVLHEYLRFMGVDDSKYQVSSRLVEALQADRRGKMSRSGSLAQDQTVVFLRSEFEVAATPEMERLQPGHQWVCNEYSAKPGDRGIVEKQRRYLFAAEQNLVKNLGSDRTRIFVYDGLELSGRDEDGNVSFLRMNADGDLLVEKTTPALFFDPVVTSSRLDSPVAQVVSYAVCLSSNLDSLPLRTLPGCGFYGSLSDRILDCAESVPTSSGKRWSLVSRNRVGRQTWRDDANGWLWSDDVLDSEATREDAIQVCASRNQLGSDAAIPGVRWALPTLSQVQTGERGGWLEISPELRGRRIWIESNEGAWTWASVEFPREGSSFHRFERIIHSIDRAGARCVGVLK